MVCYARPASWLAVIVVLAALVFGGPAGRFLDTAAFLTAAVVTTAGTAVAAALVIAAFMSTRRRRAAAGGCVGCRFRCQHAMTERPGRLSLVTTADRRPPAPGRPAPVLLPMPAMWSAGEQAGPRWPDRPLRHTDPAPRRERVGSPG